MNRPAAVSATEFVGRIQPPAEVAADLLFVPLFEDEAPGPLGAELDRITRGEVGRARETGEFRGRAYDVFVTLVVEGWQARRVALIGAGRKDDWDAERMKRIAAAAGYVARHRSVKTIGWVLREPHGGDPARAAQAAADGLSSAEYDVAAYRRSKPDHGAFPSHVTIASETGSADAISAAVNRGRVIGLAVNFARSLANEPGNVLTPREFAARVSTAGQAVGLEVEVLDDRRMRELGMGLLLGVAQGSVEPPRLIVVRHTPPGADPNGPVLGFVGKGVTFDSGGISIKPAENMDRMKDDMSGGAAVAAALVAAAQLGARSRIVGLIPTVENMPSGSAIRPGDVLTGASGKTVEVINTDAEGRLILGDALWYARQLGCTHLIDVATLTGACVVALGKWVSGLFGNDESWVRTVADAGGRAGDRLWPMPIYEEVSDQLKSDIADLVNSAGRPGGAVTAAGFLREFAGDGPWAHLDIAGTAWSEEKKPYQPKGPTGVAVRTLIELALTGVRQEPAD